MRLYFLIMQCYYHGSYPELFGYFFFLLSVSITVDDLRANTEYSGYSNASPVIQWFWEIVQGFSKEDKARLLQFVTGTSKVFFHF